MLWPYWYYEGMAMFKNSLSRPKVSVVIAFYNAERYLDQCLYTIAKQSLKEIEIICVNDGSSDNSVAIVKKYIADDFRFSLLETATNSGAGTARNLGLKNCSGEYLSFLDADDYFEEKMLEKTYQKAKKLDLDVMLFKAQGFDDETGAPINIEWSVRKDLLPQTEVFSASDIEKDFFHSGIWWAWDKLFKSEHISRNNLKFQEQRTTNDLYFVSAATITAERISYIDDILIYQRQNISTSLSSTRYLSYDCCINALKLVYIFLEEHKLLERYKNDYANYAVSFTLWNLNTIKGDSFFKLFELVESFLKDLGEVDEFYYPHLRDSYQAVIDGNVNKYLQILNQTIQDSNSNLTHEKYKAEAFIKQQAAEIISLSTEIDEKKHSIEDLQSVLETLKKQHDDLCRELELTNNRLAAIYITKTWKIAEYIKRVMGKK